MTKARAISADREENVHRVSMTGDGKWWVNRGGERVAGPLPSRAAAEEARATIEAKARRRCMCCAQPFVSEGPHNRLCPHCRRKSQPVSV